MEELETENAELKEENALLKGKLSSPESVLDAEMNRMKKQFMTEVKNKAMGNPNDAGSMIQVLHVPFAADY